MIEIILLISEIECTMQFGKNSFINKLLKIKNRSTIVQSFCVGTIFSKGLHFFKLNRRGCFLWDLPVEEQTSF